MILTEEYHNFEIESYSKSQLKKKLISFIYRYYYICIINYNLII